MLATAVRSLWPNAGIGFGPPIAEGFYYDFDVPEPFTPEDLETIEAKMAEVAGKEYEFERREVYILSDLSSSACRLLNEASVCSTSFKSP